MKKRISASLALAFALSVGATAFAANPFSDVPAKHWSYDAVAKLAAAGIVDGYGDGSFKGDKTMTRYEMATVVAKAMAKEDKANAEQKAAIDKLAAEYSSELDNLGVRVSNLEKKVDNVTFNGKVRARYDHVSQDSTASHNNSQAYLDLFLNAQINKDWKAVAEIESSKGGNTGNDGGESNTSKIYVTGPVGGTQLTAGKFGLASSFGFLDDTDVTGAKVDFGSVVKTSVRVGHLNTDSISASVGDAPTYRGVTFDYTASKATNLNAAYHRVGYTDTADVNRNIYALGFDTKFAKDFTFAAQYAKSNANTADKAYYAQVQYKAADSKVQGSYDIFLNYKKAPIGALVSDGASFDYAENFKGWQLGFDYVPMENAKFTAFYQDGRAVEGGTFDGVNVTAGEKVKAYRAQVEFYF